MNHKLIAITTTTELIVSLLILLAELKKKPADEKIWVDLTLKLANLKTANSDIIAILLAWQPETLNFLKTELEPLPSNPTAFDKAQRSFNSLLLGLRPDNAILVGPRLHRDYQIILNNFKPDIAPTLNDVNLEAATYEQLLQFYDDLLAQNREGLINYIKKTFKLNELDEILDQAERLGIRIASPDGSLALKLKSRPGGSIVYDIAIFDRVSQGEKILFNPIQSQMPAISNDGTIIMPKINKREIDLVSTDGRLLKTIKKIAIEPKSLNPFKSIDKAIDAWNLLKKEREANITEFLRISGLEFTLTAFAIFLEKIPDTDQPVRLISVSPNLKFAIVEHNSLNDYLIINNNGGRMGAFPKNNQTIFGPMINDNGIAINLIDVGSSNADLNVLLYDKDGSPIGEF